MTTVITATVFATATAATRTIAGPTVTVTATVAPPAEWMRSTAGILCYVNLALVFSSLIVIAVLGTFNRLIAVPLVACSFMALAQGMGWYGWNTYGVYSDRARRTAILISNCCYTLNESTVSLYSYFLLTKVLWGFQRRLFFSVFWTLFITLFALRIAITAVVDRYSTTPSDDEQANAAIGKLVNQLTQAALVILTTLETWCAFHLIRTFLTARKYSAAMPGGSSVAKMWSSLARSSELRVSLLALIAIARLVVFRSYDSPHTLQEIDSFAWTMQQCYPFLLQLDLIASKVVSLKVSLSRVSPADKPKAIEAAAAAAAAKMESEEKSDLGEDVLSMTITNNSGRPSSYGKSPMDVGEKPLDV